MKWKLVLGDEPADAAIRWLEAFFEQFDCAAVERLRIDRGSSRYEGVYGQCTYPTKDRPTYRLKCSAPGPFACITVTRRSPLYRRPDGSYPRAPRGCRRGDQCYDPRTGRAWYRVLGRTHLATLDEGIVWIVSHEAFHFLRRSRQVPGRNNEIEADRFADEQLEAFRESASVTPRTSLLRQMLMPWVEARL